ncbi:MAG: apolipoprotein N-acyltransferase [Thermodesulfobacteriota bacterium]
MTYFLLLLGTWLGFANPLLQLPPLVLAWPLGLVFLARSSLKTGQAFRRGWLAGILVCSACLYWVAFPVKDYTSLPLVLALPVPLLLGAYLGLFSAVFCLAVHWAQSRLSWFSLGLFAALVWICLEYLRSSLLTGFSWLSLTQALAPWPWSLQLLPLLGSFYFAGLLVLFSVWIHAGLRQKWALLAASLLLLLIAGTSLVYSENFPPDSKQVRVSLIQGNIDQDQKWEPEYQKKTVDTYQRLSQEALQAQDSDILIWPETAMPFYLQEDSELQQSVQQFVRQEQIYLITGAPGYTYLDQEEYELYNRAYLLHPNGEIAMHYEKERLVPFGEYVPLKEILPLPKLVSGARDFSPGRKIEPLQIDNLALGPLICYEIIFPQLVQKRVHQGANILLNISNDAWFGRTSAPRQHLHQAVLRALEQKRWVLRGTNTGISAVISPQGQIETASDLFQAQTLNAASSTINKRTFFSRYFEIFKKGAWICLILLTLLALQNSRQKRQH